MKCTTTVSARVSAGCLPFVGASKTTYHVIREPVRYWSNTWWAEDLGLQERLWWSGITGPPHAEQVP